MFPIWTRVIIFSLIISKADIFFDWTDQLVSVYLNGTYEGNAFFYDTQPLGANSILLYGLTPGSTGFFKNITICHVNCDSKFFFTGLVNRICC